VKSRETILNETLKKQRIDGSFGNSLDTALAVNTLQNYNYSGFAIRPAISYLMNSQRSEGSWPREVFFISYANYYGSEELTTAIATEAISRYLAKENQ
jgi:hypothetical protein